MRYETFCERVGVAGEGLDDAAGRELARHRHALVNEVGLVVTRASMEFRLELWRIRLTIANLPPAMKEQPNRAHPQDQHENNNQRFLRSHDDFVSCGEDYQHETRFSVRGLTAHLENLKFRCCSCH